MKGPGPASALFLGAADALAQPLLEHGASVVDRDRRPLSKHDRGLLVGLVKRLAVLLLGQVQVAENTPANLNRNTEERVHRRMVLGEAI